MGLPTRKIGQDDVAAMGFGLMGLSAFYGSVFESDEERFKILDAAVELGATNWDSADVYGDNEDLIGKWFKHSGKRDKIFLATKFAFTPTGINNSPEHMRSAFKKSLKRLGVDQIELYYMHRADSQVPIEQTVAEMAKLVKEGKVRYLGLSEVSESTLQRAHAVHPIAALQVEYSPFFLDIEESHIGLLKACEELGIAVVAYSPLGRGMLTGTYVSCLNTKLCVSTERAAKKSNDDIPDDDGRKTIPKFSNENFPNILKLVSTLEEIGKKHTATSSQIALAWLLTRSPSVIPIPGTKKIKYLQENLDTLKITLTDEEIKEIKSIADESNASSVGDRYQAAFMASLFADTVSLYIGHTISQSISLSSILTFNKGEGLGPYTVQLSSAWGLIPTQYWMHRLGMISNKHRVVQE